jgi:hypothetical protein
MVFSPRESYRCEELSALQLRVVRALVKAIDVDGIRFQTPFSCFGLPDSRRELRNLAQGRPPAKIDMSMPLIGDPKFPAKPLAIWKLKTGDRMHHRHFGLGTITQTTPREYDIEVVVDFDEQGPTTLGLVDSPVRFLMDTMRYHLRRLYGRK